MKRTIHTFNKSFLGISLGLLVLAGEARAADYCQNLEKFSDHSEDSTEGSSDRSVDYKEPTTNPLLPQSYRVQLLRKSVAAYYGDLDPQASISNEELDEKAEGVYFYTTQDQDKQDYVVVNVGFGGGNSASYYYKAGTLEFYPAYVYDGSCVLQGESIEFPIEKVIVPTHSSKATCTLTSGKSMIKKFTAEINLSGDMAYSNDFSVEIQETQELDPKLELLLPDFLSKKGDSSVGGTANGNVTLRYNLPTLKAQGNGQLWIVGQSISLKGNKGTISGKAYPNTAGGYWSPEAFEFKGQFSCDSDIQIKKVIYHRIIKH